MIKIIFLTVCSRHVHYECASIVNASSTFGLDISVSFKRVQLEKGRRQRMLKTILCFEIHTFLTFISQLSDVVNAVFLTIRFVNALSEQSTFSQFPKTGKTLEKHCLEKYLPFKS